jgi:Carboxypeptidase regulatory-like domain
MRKIMLALLTMALFAASIFAQTTGGRLVGTVAGADGAVVPGATVALTDKQTGKERTVTTNGDGGFSFSLLDVGTYTVKVEAKGFKVSNTTVTIQVGQEYSLPVALEVGQVSESVTVTAGADVINSTNAELSSTINNRQITELPLATRNPLALILTQAGSASNPSQNTSINGGRTSSTNISRDGINIQDNFIRSNATDFAPGRPSVDNVEEFTLTSQSSVDTGFGAAQINLVTPRGGNAFHGAVWEYNRNSKFGANSWFANAGGNYGATEAVVLAGFRKAGEERNPRPFRNRNQYGFKVSGPIIKNKLFFFAYGEKLKDIVNASKLITTLTPSAKAGLFTYQSAGVNYQANIFGSAVISGVNTPVIGVGPSGIAAPTGINSNAASLFLTKLPTGNSFETGDGVNTTGYRFFQRGDTNRDSLTSRIDYDVNERNNVSVVVDYNFEKNLRNDLDTVNVIPIVLQPARNVTYSAGWRFSPTATLSNEFRLGQFFSIPDFFRTDTLPTAFYSPTLITNPQPLNGAAVFLQQGRAVKTRNLQDTVSWTVGDHTLRFGGQFQSVKINAYNDAGIIPTYNIGLSGNGPTVSAAAIQTLAGTGAPALTPAQLTTARNLVALLGGVVSGGSQTFNANSQTSNYVNGSTFRRLLTYKSFAPYVTDQWRVNSQLTVNLGVRYDYSTPLKSENGLFFEPVIAPGKSAKDAVLDPAGAFQFVGGNAGKANLFYKADKNNWAPSVGLAYAPKNINNRFAKMIFGENFVIRGGFRVSYVNDETVRAPDGALSVNQGLSTGASATLTLPPNAPSTALDNRLGTPFASVLATPAFGSRTYLTNNTATFNNVGNVFAINPNIQSPRQNDYQVGIQRQFGDFVLEARYVGGYSKNMLRTVDYNQISLSSAFLAEFNTVRARVLSGCANNVACTTVGTGTTLPTPIFASFGATGGGITSTNGVGLLINQGQAAEFVWQYLINGNIPNTNANPVPAGSIRAGFLANPNIGTANVLDNGGSYYYNSGQFELRRNFKQGLYLQANYTFSKELTDAIGTGQTRQEPFLDNNNPSFDYARPDYDQTHVFNINTIYELPFGKNRQFLNGNKWLDYAIGGWQLGVVWRIGSGAPITFTDGRGTLNRSGRSGRQTALTNLTTKELKKLVGVFKTPCGVYFVNPTAININQSNLAAGACTTGSLNATTVAGTTGGAASSGFGGPVFAGQVFFNNGPGTTSGLRRAVVDGPWTASADVSLLKNFRITEKIGFQLRGELYNVTNTPFFAPGQFLDINGTSFGRITGTTGARVVQFAGRITF